MKEIIKSIIVEFQQRELPTVMKRKLVINTDLQIIVSLVGARRSGKTDLLYQSMNKLITDKNLNLLNFLFLTLTSLISVHN